MWSWMHATEHGEEGTRASLDMDHRTDAANPWCRTLGIERPKVRNIDSVRNLNTLTYIVINARALQRARAINTRARAP